MWSEGDMYNSEDDGEEPEWVAVERQQFAEFRDKNNDGKMDREETLDWILPSDYDHAEAEAKHLVHESDTNKVRQTVDVIFCLLALQILNSCFHVSPGWKADQEGNPRQI